MPVEIPVEKWTGKVREVTLGAGGRKKVTIGGNSTLPYLKFEGQPANPTRVAIEVQDTDPTGWSPVLRAAWGDALKDPATWAKKAAEFGAEVICLRLVSAHPEGAIRGPRRPRRRWRKCSPLWICPLWSSVPVSRPRITRC